MASVTIRITDTDEGSVELHMEPVVDPGPDISPAEQLACQIMAQVHAQVSAMEIALQQKKIKEKKRGPWWYGGDKTFG